MEKLSSYILENVVITKVTVLTHLVGDFVLAIVKLVLVFVIANSNWATDDKIHFRNLFFLIINHIYAWIREELSRLKPKSNKIQELCVLVILMIEKIAEIVENIIKKIVDYQTSFHRARQNVDKFIGFLNLIQAIICPVILKVAVDLVVKTVGKWFILPKSCEQGDPVVKFESLFFLAQIIAEVWNNFDEITHNPWEKANTSEHVNYADYLFVIWNREQVTIAYSG